MADLSPRIKEVFSTELRQVSFVSSLQGKSNWSRSGCVTCKKRRKKCDERKPRCGNCMKLGRHCEGYANLWTPPLSTATTVFKERKEPTPKRRKTSMFSSHNESQSAFSVQTAISNGNMLLCLPPHSPSVSDASETLESEDTPVSLLPQSSRSLGIGLPLDLPLFGQSETFFIQYHFERGSQRLVNLELQRNPLNVVLLPRALSSPLLLNALCTLSAGHMSNLTSSSNLDALQKAEMTYYGKTLSGVRVALSELSQQDRMSSTYMTMLEELLAAVASLCKYESVKGSVRSWRGHLIALQKLVASCGGLSNLDHDFADWLSGLMTYWQYMSNLTTPLDLAMPTAFCRGLYAMPKIDMYLGCSEQIVKICSRIARLQSFRDLALLTNEVVEINNYLSKWSCEEQSFIIPDGITEAAIGRLAIVANFFRHAAFIFMHSVLERMESHDSTKFGGSIDGSSSALWNGLHSIISLSKRQALEEIMEMLRCHPPNNLIEYSALTFPLTIAGCECGGNKEHLSLILDALKTLEVNFGIGNTRRAQELLELYWGANANSTARSRRHWLDLLEDIGWDLLLV